MPQTNSHPHATPKVTSRPLSNPNAHSWRSCCKTNRVLIRLEATPPKLNDDESSLEELAGLCEAANAIVVGSVSQKRDKPHPATLFGKGKVEDIEQLCRKIKWTCSCRSRTFSGARANLENILKVRVIDRTELILDIFARRAQTRQPSCKSSWRSCATNYRA
jgi:50S ribosomal subunit-associated GTPase HflX